MNIDLNSGITPLFISASKYLISGIEMVLENIHDLLERRFGLERASKIFTTQVCCCCQTCAKKMAYGTKEPKNGELCPLIEGDRRSLLDIYAL